MAKTNNLSKDTGADKSASTVQAPAPKPFNKGYMSKQDKQIYDKARYAGYFSFAAMFMCVCIAVLCIANTFMLKSVIDNGSGTFDTSEWIEFTLENDIGYSVKSTWNTSYYDGSLVFNPSDTTAISVTCESIETINKTSGATLTYNTLREYIDADLKNLDNAEGYSVSDVKFKEYPILDTTGYYYTFKQEQPIEDTTGTAYTESVFFIYNDYMYTFAYASPVQTYSSPDFENVLKSIRVVPENENEFTDLPDFNTKVNADSDLVSDYAEIGGEIAESINEKYGTAEVKSESE